MSVVTSYVLFVGSNEENPEGCWPAIDRLNSLIAAAHAEPGFVEIGRHAGGSKALTMPVFGYAANYFRMDKMREILRQTDWADPHLVQIAYLEEDDYDCCPHVCRLSDICREDFERR